VTAGTAGTIAVEAVKERLSRGIQKHPLQGGIKMVLTSPWLVGKAWTLAGLRTRLAWWWADRQGGGWLAWLLHQPLAVGPRRCGTPGSAVLSVQGLEMAGGDNLLTVPDPYGEGVQSAARIG
jgi:hypothetical protein